MKAAYGKSSWNGIPKTVRRRKLARERFEPPTHPEALASELPTNSVEQGGME